MANELIDLLGKSKLFSGFSLEQLEQVISHLQPKIITLKDNDRVYKKGEPAVSCWLIQSGDLMVKRASLRTPFRHMIYQKGFGNRHPRAGTSRFRARCYYDRGW